MSDFSISAVLFRAGGLAQANGFALLWFCLWTFGCLYMIAGIVWQFAGEEYLRLADDQLEVHRTLFGIGTHQYYSLSQICQLRVQGNRFPIRWRKNNMPSPFGHPLIAFDYDAKTIRFGHGLDAAEATDIVNTLCKRFPTLQ